MPGLRYQPAISTNTISFDQIDMHVPARTGGLSWDLEHLAHFPKSPVQTQPYVPARQKVNRPAQWFQRGKDDLQSNFLSTKQWGVPVNTGVVCQGSNDSDDLQVMVQDYIENDSLDYMDGVESDVGSSAAKLIENLQMLTSPYGSLERELLTDVTLLLLTINEDTDLICDPEGTDCKGGCTKRFVVKHLKTSGYNAAVCKSKWINSGKVPGGEYEFIDVVFEEEQVGKRLIVDVDFQAQFGIARPTQQYEAALKALPTVFVGTALKLEQIVELMSDAAKLSLKQNNMYLPPWRTLEYMSAKWFSNFERKSSQVLSGPFNGPCSLHWKNVKFPVPTEAKLCGNQLRRTKVSLLAEVKGSKLGNLPRGRSSRANLMLRTVLQNSPPERPLEVHQHL